MKTEWDYSQLADAYLKRPDYSADVIGKILEKTGCDNSSQVCDIGAGTAHLTLHWAKAGMVVKAVEPNTAMRRNGIKRTEEFNNVEWFEATAEETSQPDNSFDLVSFGSSFNVTDRQLALREAKRIMKDKAWFVCMWNHRDLNDPIQEKIETIIKSHIKNYDYGSRRQDQTEILEQSGLFASVEKIEGTVLHTQATDDVYRAWESHATLERQAGESFQAILQEIKNYLDSLGKNEINVPYTTRAWLAQLK